MFHFLPLAWCYRWHGCLQQRMPLGKHHATNWLLWGAVLSLSTDGIEGRIGAPEKKNYGKRNQKLQSYFLLFPCSHCWILIPLCCSLLLSFPTAVISITKPGGRALIMYICYSISVWLNQTRPSSIQSAICYLLLHVFIHHHCYTKSTNQPLPLHTNGLTPRVHSHNT